MYYTQTKQWRERLAMAVFAAFIFGPVVLHTGIARAETDVLEANPALDKAVMAALEQCQQVSSSCAATTSNAAGILVFPSVVKADLIIGGAGGKGALIEHGKITGYYSIGAGSAGLQVGVASASQVYVFRTPGALAQLKSGPDWKAGASAGVTVMSADANASSATGPVLAYVFDSKGLNAGVSVEVFDVWKTAQARPLS